MELHEFAERVLFSTTLEEKLRPPDGITDERPGPALATPEAPGRPPELRFKPQGSGKGGFPGAHRLEQECERGRLLHFFANHELLATELMALVLLRFPDAPAAFRRGVLQTLRDEQEHTRLYMRRMSECGVHFGEIPVSGYFWRCVAPMENPIDYVASLCLTFEQANLDFALHFSRGFATVGDSETAALLEKIYRDEIGHVAYGLKWFRRWKNPGESDWLAFCRQLKFPLSPGRAKGFSLNIDGRRAAGLDPGFIAELNLYSQSKGRTPGVFLFNPFSEGYIALGKSFTPGKQQAQLARDLANLPQFLCRRDDIVLVEQRPAAAFLNSVQEAGFALPQFVELGAKPAGTDAGDAAALSTLAGRKLGSLRPWAWGPDSMELLAPLFANVTGEERAVSCRFNDGIARLYSKAFSAALLREVLRGWDRPETPEEPWLCSGQEAGVPVNRLEDALAAIAAIRARGQHKIVVKESLGLAGANAIRLWEPELLEPQRRWMADILQSGRLLVVEPWLEREADFSIQLEMTADGLKLRGYTGLINDHRGQFQANWAEAGCDRRLPARITTLLGPAAGRVYNLYAAIFSRLEKEFRAADYLGPAGIDAFVYRAPEGGRRLKPIVEINPRHTMGRLTLELMKRACPGSSGLFRLVNRATVRTEGFSDFPAFARSLTERFPLRLEGGPSPRIREGALCLNDPATAQVCLALFQVSPALDTLVKRSPAAGASCSA
jgi:uncharacterized ferritin-like protein (DUF455 family)